MSPFEYLGLRPEADERDVRKAYARLLTSNRPDDDPAAFQQVNQAYQASLEVLRRRRGEADQAGHEEAQAAAPGPAPAASATIKPTAARDAHARPSAAPDEADGRPESAPAIFDFGQFIDELFHLIETRRADEVSAWLYAQPALYSIRLKSAVTMDVLRLVAEHQPPVSARALQAVSDFFGVDDLGPSGWWLTERIELARHRADMLDRFKRVPMPRSARSQDNKHLDLKIDEEIVRPRSAWRTALLLLTPGGPTRVRNRMREVDHLSDGVAEQLMDPGRRALYFELADRSRISRRRMGLSLARTGLFGGWSLLLAHWLALDVGLVAKATGMVAVAWLLWQLCVALLLKLHARLSAAGHPSAVRELSALVLLGTGITLMGLPSLNGEWSGIGYLWLIGAARLAMTQARLKAGISLVLVMLVPDLVMSGIFESPWPFQAGSFALALSTPVILSFDRIRSWHGEVPVPELATEVKPLAWLLAAMTPLSAALIYLILEPISK